MINILEYALLSSHVYGMSKQQQVQMLAGPASRNDDFISGWAYMTDVDSNMVHTNHFFAQLYLKFDNHKATDAVIAVRGTLFDDYTNKVVDILSWVTAVLGEGGHDSAPLGFTSLLVSFASKAHAYIRKYFPHISHLKFTGHSLGGALAQLMPLKAGFLGETVVFNSPGVGNVPGVIANNQYWITNVNSHYGVINKIGKLLGKLYVIDVPNDESEAKRLFASMDMKDYGISESYYHLSEIIGKSMISKILYLGEQNLLDAAGLHYRIASYISTFNSLDNDSQTAQAIAVNCKTSASSATAWNMVKSKVSNTICEEKYKGAKLNEIITAQHSIDNMVIALQQKQYTSVAYQCV